ncbi:DegT/DnrJ/EryC1/StrS family aminotransferase [Candidatus Peregrinibacteria bacterium]|nr:DegT/DnrJ/EryC1/StrS family aminotransferase [Candidatus Peregrinibacteria bacterium]
MSNNLAILGGKKLLKEDFFKKWPPVNEQDNEYVLSVLKRGPSSVDTPHIQSLEKEWARYVGTKYALATNSGTAALHMCVAALGIGPGDEVIIPAFTFLASATCVLHHNGIPVFVDVDPETMLIDVSKIEGKITKYTKAIIPVHLNGVAADMDTVLKIAEKHNLVVIEDAAQAHGSLYRGKKVGNFGHMAGFSINHWKHLSALDGGLLVTNDEELRDKAEMVRQFGESIHKGKQREYNSYTMGWMYRTTEFVAAFARSQLTRLDENNAKRIENCGYLDKELSKIKGIRLQKVPEGSMDIYWFYMTWISPEDIGIDVEPAKFRIALQEALCAEGLNACLWQTRPVPRQSLFSDMVGYGKGCPWRCHHYRGNVNYNEESYPGAQAICDHTVWLSWGFAPPNGKRELDGIIEVYQKVFKHIDAVAEYANTKKAVGS